jgi:hypothetical protein
MPCQRPSRPLSALASALAAAGTALAVVGCGHITPLGPASAPVKLPPARELGSPITMQIMRSQAATPAGRCPAGSVNLSGLEPDVPRQATAVAGPKQVAGSPVTPTPVARPATTPELPTGVACYRPVGTPVTITSAAVSAVTTFQHQPGPAAYGFVVAFPAADVPALTAVATRAYDAGDAIGMSVAGRLWQAPPTRNKLIALRAEQINLLSRNQAVHLYRLLVPARSR